MNPSPVTWLILGGGGHAGVVLRLLLHLGHRVSGYLAPQANAITLTTLAWAGNDQLLETLDPDTTSLACGLGSVGAINLRKTVFLQARALGFNFPNLFHPTSVVSENNQLGSGLQLHTLAIINGNTRIGDNVLINTAAIVEHECDIGDHCHIASGAVICGGVRIGESCHIGANATINQGIRIGGGAVIASGAVVISDVAAHTLMAGVPAIVKKQLIP